MGGGTTTLTKHFTIANMYQKQMGLALFGIGICALPVIIPLIPKIGSYIEVERLKAETELRLQNVQTQEEFERHLITERAKTSDQLYKSGIAPNTSKLRIRRYFDNSKQDPKPDTTGWGADEVVFVYDSAGACIGRIEDNKWNWKHKVKNACKGRPS